MITTHDRCLLARKRRDPPLPQPVIRTPSRQLPQFASLLVFRRGRVRPSLHVFKTCCPRSAYSTNIQAIPLSLTHKGMRGRWWQYNNNSSSGSTAYGTIADAETDESRVDWEQHHQYHLRQQQPSASLGTGEGGTVSSQYDSNLNIPRAGCLFQSVLLIARLIVSHTAPVSPVPWTSAVRLCDRSCLMCGVFRVGVVIISYLLGIFSTGSGLREQV